MDLLGEASGTRVLAARHISAGKSLPVQNNTINSALLCHSYSLFPDFNSYTTALQSYVWVLWPCGLAAVLATCLIYFLTLKRAVKSWQKCTTNLAVVLAVYPVVAGAGFIAVVVPRARILSEAIAQQAVMLAMYHLYCLIIAECGGVEQLVRRAGGSRLETRVLPCCCWPCCLIPKPELKAKNLTWLRYLVVQMPVAAALIYTVILVICAEEMAVYMRSFVYFQPLIAASILSGVWGMVMCVRAAESAGARPRPRFLVLQLVLLVVKLQCGMAKFIPETFNMPCIVALNPAVFVNMIQNSVMILEMLVLSLFAWRLYSVPAIKVVDRVPPVVVAVLDDTTLDAHVFSDGIANKSFTSRNELKWH